MAAPAVVAVVAFLGGAQVAGLTGVATTTGAVIADVDGAVIDLNKLCKATDPLVDAVGDVFSKSTVLKDIVRAADKVCAAAAAGPGVVTDARFVGLALTAIGAAQAKIHGAMTVVPIPGAPARKATAR